MRSGKRRQMGSQSAKRLLDPHRQCRKDTCTTRSAWYLVRGTRLTYVMSRMIVKGTLPKNDQIMLRGTIKLASDTSSAMCATESDPRTTNMVETWPTKTASLTLGQPAPLSVN